MAMREQEAGNGDCAVTYFADMSIFAEISHHMSWQVGDDRSRAGFDEDGLGHNDHPSSSGC